MKSSLTVANFFFLRRSSGSLGDLKRLGLEHLNVSDVDALNGLISSLLSDVQFSFALRHAAPQAWMNATVAMQGGTGLKTTKKIVHALLRYYSRFCSRPTPYGAFGLVGAGTFNELSDPDALVGESRLVAKTDYRCFE